MQYHFCEIGLLRSIRLFARRSGMTIGWELSDTTIRHEQLRKIYVESDEGKGGLRFTPRIRPSRSPSLDVIFRFKHGTWSRFSAEASLHRRLFLLDCLFNASERSKRKRKHRRRAPGETSPRFWNEGNSRRQELGSRTVENPISSAAIGS